MTFKGADDFKPKSITVKAYNFVQASCRTCKSELCDWKRWRPLANHEKFAEG